MLLNNLKICIGDSSIKKIYKGNKLVHYNYPKVLSISLYRNGVKVDENQLNLNTPYTIKAILTPSNCISNDITFNCSDVNAIIKDNVVTFHRIGAYKLYASTFNGVYGEISCRAGKYIDYPNSIMIDKSLYYRPIFEEDNKVHTLATNTKYYLNSTVFPNDVVNKVVTYSCDNDDVIINKNEVIFKEVGTFNICATTENQKSDTAEFCVNAYSDEIPLEFVYLDDFLYGDAELTKPVNTINVNKWYFVKVNRTPENAQLSNITFQYPSDVKMEHDGQTHKIMFTQGGEKNIGVKMESKPYEYTTYDVEMTVTGLSIKGLKDVDTSDIQLGTWYQIEYSLTPEGATDTVVFTCPNSNATISGNKIKFSAYDQEYKITGTCQTSGVKGGLTITLKKQEIPMTSITIIGLQEVESPNARSGLQDTYKQGKWYKVICSFTPSDATLTDYSISAVRGDGDYETDTNCIMSKSASEISIQVQSTDGSCTDEATFTFEKEDVPDPCTDVTINGIQGYTDDQLELNKWYDIDYSTTPAGKVPTFTSGSSSVTINGTQIKFLAYGTYTIKATIESQTATRNITVTEKIVTYSISNNLTNCVTNNSVSTISSGETYSATISANSGYTLGTIKVTMGGNDISSSVVSGNNVSISKVIGDIVITCSATKNSATYTITNSLTNCSSNNNTSSIQENSSYSATISANNGYTLGNITVTMGGTNVTSSAVSGNKITISKVTGNLVITCSATLNSTPAEKIAITLVTSDNLTVNKGNSFTINFKTNRQASKIEVSEDGGSNYYTYNCSESSKDGYYIYIYKSANITDMTYNPITRIIKVTDSDNNTATKKYTITIADSQNTPDTYSIDGQQLIAQQYASSHDGNPNGMGTDAYGDMYYKPRINPDGTFPNSEWNAASMWMTSYLEKGASYYDNVGLRLENPRMYMFDFTKQKWCKLDDTFNWGTWYLENFWNDGNGDIANSVNWDTDKKGVTVLQDSTTSGRCFHAFTNQNDWRNSSIDHRGTPYIITAVDFKLVKFNSSGVDNLSNAKILVNAGCDWWSYVGASWNSDWTTNRDMAVGKFIKATTTMQRAYCTNIPQNWSYGFDIENSSSSSPTPTDKIAITTVTSNNLTVTKGNSFSIDFKTNVRATKVEISENAGADYYTYVCNENYQNNTYTYTYNSVDITDDTYNPITRIIRVTDANGNTDSKTYTITIKDSESTTPTDKIAITTVTNENLTVNKGDSFSIAFKTNVKATKIQISEDAGSSFYNYTCSESYNNGVYTYTYNSVNINDDTWNPITRIVKVTDANGNTDSKTYTITINDSSSNNFTITYNLTNCNSTNKDVTIASGSAYSSTISANSGYTLGSVKVTMNGSNVTSSVVNGGKITISKVTGNLVITSNATKNSATYTITNNLTNCSSSNSVSSIKENSSYSATISPSSGYTLGSITVTMGGSNITSSVVSGSYIYISGVTGNVVITCSATSQSTTLKDFSGADDAIALARTYYSNRSKYITYGNTNIMTDFGARSWTSVTTSTGADSPDGRYRYLDCSSLVGLCMRGIAFSEVFASKTVYENKSLSPRTSTYSWSASMSEFPRLAREQYDYCKNRGWMLDQSKWHIGGTWAGLKKGDLIFWYNGKKINHVAFYYGLNSENKPAIIECTSYSYVSKHTDWTSTNNYGYGVTIQTMENLKANYNSKYTTIYAVARPQL